jgi:hypothetical protein
MQSFVILRKLLVMGLVVSSCFSMASGRMPQTQTESLDAVSMNLPADLPADPTIVMIGYEFAHQAKLDEWVAKMNLKEDRKEWIQIHLISRGYSWISGFINARKRPYFPDSYSRARVVPIYSHIETFNQSLGLPLATNVPYILVINRGGEVLHFEQGDFSTDKAAAINKAFL